MNWIMECAVCFESFLRDPNDLLTCQRQCAICKACNREYASTAPIIRSQGLMCAFQCGTVINAAAFPDLVGEESAKNLNNAISELYVLENSRLCANPECGARVSVEYECAPEEYAWFTCSWCCSATCKSCEREAHEDRTCEEYEQELTMAQAGLGMTSEMLINATTKKCPSCNLRSVRISGCAHMSCYRCGFQWCWGCVQERTSHSSAGHESCQSRIQKFETRAREMMRMAKDRAYALLRERKANYHRALRQANELLRTIGPSVMVKAGVDEKGKMVGEGVFDMEAVFLGIVDECFGDNVDSSTAARQQLEDAFVVHQAREARRRAVDEEMQEEDEQRAFELFADVLAEQEEPAAATREPFRREPFRYEEEEWPALSCSATMQPFRVDRRVLALSH